MLCCTCILSICMVDPEISGVQGYPGYMSSNDTLLLKNHHNKKWIVMPMWQLRLGKVEHIKHIKSWNYKYWRHMFSSQKDHLIFWYRALKYRAFKVQVLYFKSLVMLTVHRNVMVHSILTCQWRHNLPREKRNWWLKIMFLYVTGWGAFSGVQGHRSHHECA